MTGQVSQKKRTGVSISWVHPASAGFLLVLGACSSSTGTDQQESPGALPKTGLPEPAGDPNRVYWGDLHLHSNLSFDAYAYGLHSVSPSDAYRFARGEEVRSETGVKAKLKRPLDFLMVSDHGEYLGVLKGAAEHNSLLGNYPAGSRWLRYAKQGEFGKIFGEALNPVDAADAQAPPPDFAQTIWGDVGRVADQFYEPGKFTTFIGYEWTASRAGSTLHRVVVFADGADKTNRLLPFSAVESNNPEDLWDALQSYKSLTGGSALTIAHNGNLSQGMMFDDIDSFGRPLSPAYRTARRQFEPIVEVTQVKGDSETHPLISPDDEFADFERWGNAGRETSGTAGGLGNSEDAVILRRKLEGSYVRSALKKGLTYQAKDGINPYEFGMIGSTDMHTGLSAADEDNFFGKFPDSEPGLGRLASRLGGSFWPGADLSAAGYVGVWARQNTREEIFAALLRREVYASSGPRIALRFFGGWDLAESMLATNRYVEAGYRFGVPMGGVLKRNPEGKVPTFLVVATKDPNSVNLDRVQVVKGWRDQRGNLHEKVHDIALSNGQTVDPATGRAPPLPDRAKGDKGAVELRAFWRDPDFESAEQAFYYVRVLQIQSPRWSTYDARRYNLPLPNNQPAMIQDRVYSSPIWYRAPIVENKTAHSRAPRPPLLLRPAAFATYGRGQYAKEGARSKWSQRGSSSSG